MPHNYAPLLLLLLALPNGAAFSSPTYATTLRVAKRACSTPVPSMIEPITTAAAFTAGLLGPSLVAMQKDGALQGANSKLDTAEAELAVLRLSLEDALSQLEIAADTSEMALNEILLLSVREARSRKDEIATIKSRYEQQIRDLKELVGDYNDRMELQQNKIMRNSQITDSARAEAAAYRERANLMADKLEASEARLTQLEKEINANPIARFFLRR